MLHASADNTHVNINVKHTKGRRRCRRRGGLEREPFLVARYPGHRIRMAKGLGTSGGSRLGVGHAIGLGIEQGRGSGGGSVGQAAVCCLISGAVFAAIISQHSERNVKTVQFWQLIARFSSYPNHCTCIYLCVCVCVCVL